MSRLFNYNKEGPGVTKEQVAAETPLKRFFTEFIHRFWQMIVLNLLYLLACVPIITIGPATAAVNYVSRNFSQAKPVDMFSDFVEKCKEYFKKGFVVSLIQLFVSALLITSFLSWTSGDFDFSQGWRTAAIVVIFFVGYLLICSFFYVYPMMVSFDLTVKQLLRNSVILALTQLWRNIVMLLVAAVFVILTFLFWPLTFPVPLFIAFSAVFFVSNSLVFPVLKKYVATPEKSEELSSEEIQESDEQAE